VTTKRACFTICFLARLTTQHPEKGRGKGACVRVSKRICSLDIFFLSLSLYLTLTSNIPRPKLVGVRRRRKKFLLGMEDGRRTLLTTKAPAQQQSRLRQSGDVVRSEETFLFHRIFIFALARFGAMPLLLWTGKILSPPHPPLSPFRLRKD
jgi:hypothetical protein